MGTKSRSRQSELFQYFVTHIPQTGYWHRIGPKTDEKLRQNKAIMEGIMSWKKNYWFVLLGVAALATPGFWAACEDVPLDPVGNPNHPGGGDGDTDSDADGDTGLSRFRALGAGL